MFNLLPVLVVIIVLASILTLFSLPSFAEQTPAVNLSNSTGEARNVQLFVQGNNVYTVLTDDAPGNSDVFFTKSENGASFETPLNLSANNGSSAFPRLVVSEPNLYLVWYYY